MNQLRQQTNSATHNSGVTVKDHELKQTISEVELTEIDQLLGETSGIWGRMSREEIDAQLERQRKFDWGE